MLLFIACAEYVGMYYENPEWLCQGIFTSANT